MTVDAHDWEEPDQDRVDRVLDEMEQNDRIAKLEKQFADADCTAKKIGTAYAIINRCIDLQLSLQCELAGDLRQLEKSATAYLCREFDIPPAGEMLNHDTVDLTELSEAAECASKQNGKSMAENALAMMQSGELPKTYGSHSYEQLLGDNAQTDNLIGEVPLSVHDARTRNVCRFCKGPASNRRIGNIIDPFDREGGLEHGHRSCLNWYRAQKPSTKPTIRFQRVVARAHEIAHQLGDNFAGVEHMALAMCEEPIDTVPAHALDAIDKMSPIIGLQQWKNEICRLLGQHKEEAAHDNDA